MNSIDKKTSEKLKEKHKDVFENPAIDSLIRLKRKGDAGRLEYNPADYPVMNNETYSRKLKDNLPYFLKRL